MKEYERIMGDVWCDGGLKKLGDEDENLGSLDEHRIEFDEQLEGGENDINLSHNNKLPARDGGFRSDFISSSVENLPTSSYSNVSRQIKKRVTVFIQPRDRSTVESRYGKLMLLPNSIEELCKVAGKVTFDKNQTRL